MPRPGGPPSLCGKSSVAALSGIEEIGNRHDSMRNPLCCKHIYTIALIEFLSPRNLVHSKFGAPSLSGLSCKMFAQADRARAELAELTGQATEEAGLTCLFSLRVTLLRVLLEFRVWPGHRNEEAETPADLVARISSAEDYLRIAAADMRKK